MWLKMLGSIFWVSHFVGIIGAGLKSSFEIVVIYPQFLTLKHIKGKKDQKRKRNN